MALSHARVMLGSFQIASVWNCDCNECKSANEQFCLEANSFGEQERKLNERFPDLLSIEAFVRKNIPETCWSSLVFTPFVPSGSYKPEKK